MFSNAVAHINSWYPSAGLDLYPSTFSFTKLAGKIAFEMLSSLCQFAQSLKKRTIRPLHLKNEFTTSQITFFEALIQKPHLAPFINYVDKGDFEGFKKSLVNLPGNENLQDAKIKKYKVLFYQNGWEADKLEARLNSLALEGTRYKDISLFLKQKKIFGNKGSDPLFQAGLFLLENKLRRFRDQQLAHVLFKLIHLLRHTSAGDTKKRQAKKMVEDLAFLATVSPTYCQLKESQGSMHPLIALTQDLCSTLVVKGMGQRILRKFGERHLGKSVSNKRGIGFLGEKLKEAAENRIRIPYLLSETQKREYELLFNREIGTFTLEEKTVRVCSGIQRRDDPALRHHLDALRENKAKQLILSLDKVPKYLEEMHHSALETAALPLFECETTTGFFEHYAKKLAHKPNSFMSEEQGLLALKHAASLFKELESKEGKKYAFKLGVQGFFEVGHFLSLLKEGQTDWVLKGVCEKNPDKGFVLSVLTEIYLSLLRGETLSHSFLQEIMGMAFSRLELDSSSLTSDTYKTLSELLLFIADHEDRFKVALRGFAQEGYGIAGKSIERFSSSVQEKKVSDKELSIEEEIRAGLKEFRPIKNKGMYGSIIYCNRKGEKFGIFKAIDAQFSLKKKLIGKTIESVNIGGQEGYLPMVQERLKGAMVSERASYLLDHVLGTHCVPKTEIINAQGRLGSFQHFVKNYREAQETPIPTPQTANQSDIDQFQRFAVVDFLMGNLDRKPDNWMVKMTPDGRHFEDIKMIDNANCFPRGHLPNDHRPIDVARRHQYEWKKFALAKLPFSKETKKLINTFTDEKIEELIAVWKADLGEEVFFNFFGREDGPVLEALKDRLKLLRKFAAETRTLTQLGNMGTFREIKKHLKESLCAPKASFVAVENL